MCWRWRRQLPRRRPPQTGPSAGLAVRVSAGRGAKGHRLYDWAFIRLDNRDPHPGGQAGQHWLLVRRNPPPVS